MCWYVHAKGGVIPAAHFYIHKPLAYFISYERKGAALAPHPSSLDTIPKLSKNALLKAAFRRRMPEDSSHPLAALRHCQWEGRAL